MKNIEDRGVICVLSDYNKAKAEGRAEGEARKAEKIAKNLYLHIGLSLEQVSETVEVPYEQLMDWKSKWD